jgi:23S rRNA (guanosine2251-2'-O)-methyltransferase
VLHATNLRIPVVEVEGGTLTSLAGFDGHQGVAVVVGPRRFATLDEILARAVERSEPPFVLALDSLEDPQNLGTLLRSAEAAGVHGVVFPTRRQAPLSPAAVKASAGAVEHLLLCPVDDLAAALSDLHVRGLRVIGAEADAPLTAREADLRGPLAIVVGSEGQGLGSAVRRRCDVLVRIPMRGQIESLNAAVAGSILLFEAVSQRGGEATPRTTQPLSPEPQAGQPSTEAGSRPADAAEARDVAAAADASDIAAAGDAPDGHDAANGPDAANGADANPPDAARPATATQPKPRKRRTNPPVTDEPPTSPAPTADEAIENDAKPLAAADDLLPGGPPPAPESPTTVDPVAAAESSVAGSEQDAGRPSET